jgi:hypothetical protein
MYGVYAKECSSYNSYGERYPVKQKSLGLDLSANETSYEFSDNMVLLTDEYLVGQDRTSVTIEQEDFIDVYVSEADGTLSEMMEQFDELLGSYLGEFDE